MFKLQFKSTLGSHTQKTLIPSLRSLKKKSLHHGCFCYFNTDRFHRVNTSVYIYILISYKYITFTQTFFMWKFIPVKIHEIMQRITRVVDEEFCKKMISTSICLSCIFTLYIMCTSIFEAWSIHMFTVYPTKYTNCYVCCGYVIISGFLRCSVLENSGKIISHKNESLRCVTKHANCWQSYQHRTFFIRSVLMVTLIFSNTALVIICVMI